MDAYLAVPQNKYTAKAFLGVTVGKQKGKKLITWGSYEVSKTSNFILIWSVGGSPSDPEGGALSWAPPFWTASLSLIFPHRPTPPSNRACLSRCVSTAGCGHRDFQILPEPRTRLRSESLHHGFLHCSQMTSSGYLRSSSLELRAWKLQLRRNMGGANL